MFYDWLETNQVPKSAIALWHSLMHIANKAGWEESFTVAISIIESKTGFKRSELYEARNLLTQKGRLNWKQRGGNLCAEYELIFFCVHNTDTSAEAKAYTNGNTNGYTKPTQTGTINKLDKTKLNTSKSHLPPEGGSSEKKEIDYWKLLCKCWFDFYEKQFSAPPSFDATKGKALKSIVARLKTLSAAKGREWTEEQALKSLAYFFKKSWEHDTWLQINFELPVLSQKFDSITNSKKNDTTNRKTASRTGNTGQPGSRLQPL